MKFHCSVCDFVVRFFLFQKLSVDEDSNICSCFSCSLAAKFHVAAVHKVADSGMKKESQRNLIGKAL